MLTYFVKYYYNFKDKSRDECIMLFDEDFTDKAKGTRTGHAQRIFRENKHLEALTIIADSNRVDDATRKRATNDNNKEKNYGHE